MLPGSVASAEASGSSAPDVTRFSERENKTANENDGTWQQRGNSGQTADEHALASAVCWTVSEGKATVEDSVRSVDICNQERKDLDGNHRAVRRLWTRSFEIISLSLSRARF